MKQCLECNEPIKKTNKFCGSSCAATYNNKRRTLSEETKLKIKISMQTFAKENDIFGGREGIEKSIATHREESYKNKMSQIAKKNGYNRPRVWTEKESVYINREGVHRHRAKKLGLLPEDADIRKIQEVYLNTPDGHEVDHIKPISKGGLHHQDNLQYLTVVANRSKGNKYKE